MQNYNPKFKIVLIAPEIPGNTGTIGRTCVALNIQLILIGKLGFDISEKAVRRAGLDYWKYADIKQYEDFEQFISEEQIKPHQLFFFENKQDQNIYKAKFVEDSYLVFGSETKGIDSKILEKYDDRIFELPMYSDKIRSLNLSNAATAAAYECLRQLRYSC